MSMSGWWSAAFAASATLFTKVIATRKSLKAYVRRIIPPSSAQPGWAFSQPCTSASPSFVLSRAMAGSLRPFHRPLPLGERARPSTVVHLRFERFSRPPGAANLLRVLPHACPDARQERGSCRGGLEIPRPYHRNPKDVRLVLHQEIVGARAPIHLEHRDGLPRVLGHRLRQLVGLQRDALEHRPGHVPEVGGAVE